MASEEAVKEGERDYRDTPGAVLEFIRRVHLVATGVMTRFREHYVKYLRSHTNGAPYDGAAPYMIQ